MKLSLLLVEYLKCNHGLLQFLQIQLLEAEDLDEDRLLEAQKKAQEELSKLENTEQIASVENELAVLAAEIATVRKLKRQI